MERLIYSSRRRDDTGGSGFSPQFAEIAQVAAELNARSGITGFLLCTPCWFAQILEGETAPLDQLLASLLRDDRHWDLRVLARGSMYQRLFPEWNMGWRHRTIANRIVFLEHDLAHDLPPGSGEVEAVLNVALRLADIRPLDRLIAV